ncbi:hypothetical protein WKW79_11860 [Variovorax robiniae]|uniref:Uncharacterized protein n=1 Tax=Variovorax robiniae TaxID=1836199 RepID=A0ABU8X639_9BURK
MKRRAAPVKKSLLRPRWGSRWFTPVLVCAALMANATGEDPDEQSEVWMAVSDNKLDDLRGGFDLGSGLLVSFGITRAVYVNGDLVTQTTLDFGNLTNLTPAQAAQLNTQLRTLNLVQIGPGNVVDPSINLGAGGTIVQNTLNDQHINNQTIINASSNSMGTMKALNSMATISDAVTRGLGR